VVAARKGNIGSVVRGGAFVVRETGQQKSDHSPVWMKRASGVSDSLRVAAQFVPIGFHAYCRFAYCEQTLLRTGVRFLIELNHASTPGGRHGSAPTQRREAA
jgi:hypothetical protein